MRLGAQSRSPEPGAHERVRRPPHGTTFNADRRTRRTTWGPASRLRFASAFTRNATALTTTKLEERSRVGEARRSAKHGGGSRIGRNPPEGGRHVSAGSAGSALIVVGLDRDVRRRSTFEAVSAEV